MARRKTRVVAAALLLALLLAALPHALARPVIYEDTEERPQRPLRQIAPIPITPVPTPTPPAPSPSPAPPAIPTTPSPAPRRPLPFDDPVEWLVKQAREVLKPLLPQQPQPQPVRPVSPVRPEEFVPGVKAYVRVLADTEELVKEVLRKEGLRVGEGRTEGVRASPEVRDSVEGFKEKLKRDERLWRELSDLFGGEDKLVRYLDSLKGGFERRYDAVIPEGGAYYRAELKAAQDLAVNLRYAVEEAIKDAVLQDVKGTPVKWYINTGMKPYLSGSVYGAFSRARDLIVKLLSRLGIPYHETATSAVAKVLGERLKQVGLDKFLGKAAGAVVVVTVADVTLELHVKEAAAMPKAYCAHVGDTVVCFDEKGNPVKPEKVRFGGNVA